MLFNATQNPLSTIKKLPIPLLKQRRLACGPTALGMVLKYFGKEISQEEITKRVGGIKNYGVKTIKLAEFAKSLGFKVECYSYNENLAKGKAKIKKPSKSDIIKFLQKKLPVILAVRKSLFSNEQSEIGHFIVITKYEKGKFWYNDPDGGKRRVINEDDLMFAWHSNVLDSSAYLLVLQLK